MKSINGVDLGDDDAASEGLQGGGRSLSDISVSGDDSHLSGQHDVGGSLDSVGQGLADSVQIVELALGDGVVDIDRGDLEFSLLEHLSQVVDSGGRLLRQAADVLNVLGVLLVDDVGQVASVVEDHVQGLAVGPNDGLNRGK